MKNKRSALPWHVAIFSVYPAFALWAHNIGQVGFAATYRAILASFLLGIGLLLLSWLWLRDWPRAGILATLLLGLFFSYGHVYSFIGKAQAFGFLIGRHRFLAIFWVILAGVAIWWVAKKLKAADAITTGLNFMASF